MGDGSLVESNFNETFSSAIMRELLPDVALEMETTLLHKTLTSNGVVSNVRKLKKTYKISIPTEDGHLITLEPVDKGFEGFFKWFTWQRVDTELNYKTPEGMLNLSMSIRCYVTIHKMEKPSEKIVAFTTHQDNLRKIIRSALHSLATHTNTLSRPVKLSSWKH